MVVFVDDEDGDEDGNTDDCVVLFDICDSEIIVCVLPCLSSGVSGDRLGLWIGRAGSVSPVLVLLVSLVLLVLLALFMAVLIILGSLLFLFLLLLTGFVGDSVSSHAFSRLRKKGLIKSPSAIAVRLETSISRSVASLLYSGIDW